MADWLNDPTDAAVPAPIDQTQTASPIDWLNPPTAQDLTPTLRQAVQQNPDQAAANQKLSQQTGVPVQAIQANPAPFQTEQKVQAVQAATADAPVTQSFLANAQNAAVAHDDAASLAAIEHAWTHGRYQTTISQAEGESGLDDLRSLVGGLASDIGSALRAPKILSDIAKRQIEHLFGDNPAVNAGLEAAGSTNPLAGLTDYADMLGQQESKIEAQIMPDPSKQNVGTEVSYSLGQVAGQIALALTTGGATSAASMGGFVAQGVDQMDQAVKATGKEGTEGGDLATLAGAGVTAILSRFGLSTLLEKIPAMQANWVLKTLAGFGVNATETIAQQVGQNLILHAAVDPDRPIFDNILQSGEVGGLTGAIVSALLPGHAMHIAEENKAKLDATKTAMDQSTLMTRDPEKLAQHFSAVAQANGKTDFYVPADRLLAAYGTEDDPSTAPQVAETLGIDPADLNKALLNGDDVRFAPEQFAKSILMSDKYETIADDVRQNADGLTVNEANEQQKAAVASATKAASEVAKPAAEKAPTELAPEHIAALKEAGFTDEEIKSISAEDAKDLVGDVPEATGKAQEPASPAVKQAADIAHSQLGLDALFKTANEAGMTPKQYEAYLATKSSADDKAAFRLQRRVAREQLKQTTDQWNAARDTERRSVEADVHQEPGYSALVVGNAGVDRISRESIERTLEDEMRYDPKTGENKYVTSADQFNEIKDQLPKRTDGKNVYTSDKGGMDIETAAKLHGFDRGIDLLTHWLTAEPMKDRIERLTDERMQQKHNDLGNQRKLLEAAVQETHSDQQAAVLAHEVNALAQAKKEQRIKPKDVRRYAAQQFGGYTLREAIPDKFFTASARLGRLTGQLLRKGNRSGAVIAKFKQLVQFQMAREAYEFKAQLAKDQKYLAKWAKPRKEWPDVQSAYVKQIHDMLAPFRVRPDNAAERLDKWFADRIRQDGASFSPDTIAAAKSLKTNVRDMTVQDYRDLVNAVRELHAQGREAMQAIKGKEIVERQKLVSDMLDTLKDRPDSNKAQAQRTTGTRTRIGRIADKIAGFHAAMRKMEFILHDLDGGEFNGIWHKTFFQPIADAEAHGMDLLKQHVEPLAKELHALDKKMPRNLKFSRKVFVPELGQSFPLGDIFGMALNMGNESNADALIRGGSSTEERLAGNNYATNWTEQGVTAAIRQLSPEHIKLLQKFWDTFETLHPQVAEIYRREHGIDPEKIEPREMTVHGITVKGGYFPLKYDAERGGVTTGSNIKLSDIGMSVPDMQETVYSGMTKARTGSKARAVNIHQEGIFRGFYQTAHYISHYDAVRNIQKILNGSADLRATLKRKMGDSYLDQMDDWLGAVASGIHNFSDASVKHFVGGYNWLSRTQVSAVLSLNVLVAAKQLFGVGPSISLLGMGPEGHGFSSLGGLGRMIQGYGIGTKAGVSWMTRGLTQMAQDPDNAIKQIYEKSGEMRNRVHSMAREVDQRVNQMAGRDTFMKKLGRAGMWPIHAMQFYGVDVPTWLGAYNQGLAHNLTDEDAVHYADKIVRMSQGSGAQKDLSSAQRQELLGSITRLASWTFTSYNQVASGVRSVQDKGWRDLPAGAQKAMWMLVVPAIAQELLFQHNADQDQWGKRALRTMLNAVTSAIPIAGPWLQSALTGNEPHLAILDDLGKNIAQASTTVANAFKHPTPSHNAKAIEESVLALLAAAGLPYVQARRTLSAVHAGSSNPLDYILGVSNKK